MDKIWKESDLRKEKRGSPSIQESKIAAKFSKRLSIRTVTPLRDIFREDLGPQLPHDATCFHVPLLWKMFAPLASCLPWWSAMHDVCVAYAKKCAVAMGREPPSDTPGWAPGRSNLRLCSLPSQITEKDAKLYFRFLPQICPS